ncbi:glycosyltransferase [Fibrobacter sp.]|uniref:glycosyltransferase n=1 Tax=Fibrobacter sp. TaxID=35828 RepID=UPI001B2F3091|nr:glycosyltransferase [Fibrobacter sp.]MBO7060496.1 glycosyltransferase [Fibrobacter sp.]
MNSRKKVLLVCDKNECTSFGRLAHSIMHALEPEFDCGTIWLKTPKFFGNHSERDELEIWAPSLHVGFFTFRHPFKKILRRERPDVVLFIRPELGFLVPVAKSAIPEARCVMFVHDTFAETLYPDSLKFKVLNRFFIRDTVKSDYYVYNSRWTRTEAEAHFGTAGTRGTVIGCPIDSSLFSAPSQPVDAADRAAFREKFDIRGFKAMCLNVSLDEPRKNIETYFEMARLCPDVAFVRVGKVSERLEQIIARDHLNNVFHFPEFKAHELRDFYRHADLMVYPSLLEGFGMPPIEALSCGTPSVAAATSAMKENLEGVVPLVDPPTDAGAFVKILERVLAGENIVNAENKDKLLEYCSSASFARRVGAAILESLE